MARSQSPRNRKPFRLRRLFSEGLFARKYFGAAAKGSAIHGTGGEARYGFNAKSQLGPTGCARIVEPFTAILWQVNDRGSVLVFQQNVVVGYEWIVWFFLARFTELWRQIRNQRRDADDFIPGPGHLVGDHIQLIGRGDACLDGGLRLVDDGGSMHRFAAKVRDRRNVSPAKELVFAFLFKTPNRRRFL